MFLEHINIQNRGLANEHNTEIGTCFGEFTVKDNYSWLENNLPSHVGKEAIKNQSACLHPLGQSSFFAWKAKIAKGDNI